VRVIVLRYRNRRVSRRPGMVEESPRVFEHPGLLASREGTATMPTYLTRCLRCERDLPRSEFNKNSRRKTGLQAYCKPCKRRANKETRRARGAPSVPDEKRCSKCGDLLAAAEFCRDAAQKTGLTSWCRACVNNKNSTLTAARHEADPLKNLPVDRKHCPRCRRVRRVEFFCRDEGRRDKRAPWCRDCTRGANEEQRARNPERVKAVQKRGHLNYRLKQFGLTRAEYEAMIAACGNKCEICGSPPIDPRAESPVLSIDHCHATGEVRGLLCARCNHGLGHFKDDPRRLLLAARYLLKHRRPADV